jgi:Flp pilus assembly protein TadD
MAEGLVARLKRNWSEANGLNRQKDRAEAVKRSRRLLLEDREQENHEFLEDALIRFPEDAELRLLFASNLLAIRPEDAAGEAIKAVELNPDEPILLIRAASLLVAMGRVDVARDYAKRSRELASADFPFKAELINLEARFAAIDGRDAEAERGFRRAVELDPKAEALALDLARHLARRNREEEALHVIEQGLESATQTGNLLRLRNELSDEPERDGRSQG